MIRARFKVEIHLIFLLFRTLCLFALVSILDSAI